MKRIAVLLVLLVLGVSVHAQRPVGDTINVGEGDYWYDTVHRTGLYYISSAIHSIYDFPNWAYSNYVMDIIPLSEVIRYSYEAMRAYPDIYVNGSHIAGQQFCLSRDEEIRVIGLGVCPLVNPHLEHNTDSTLYYYYQTPIIDTTIAGRLTEYVQLYTIEDGTLRFQAEGPWRVEYPHRYMQFPHYYAWRDTLDESSNPSRQFVLIDSTIVTPLYEVMFDTGVVIQDGTFVIAGTHNNNVCHLLDTNVPNYYIPRCHDHLPTCYTACFVREMPFYSERDIGLPFPDLENRDSVPFLRPIWMKYDTLPWVELYRTSIYGEQCGDTLMRRRPYWVYNFFPILDTLWGTPCGAVTGMQSVVIDSVTATVMWSSDARHHHWEVSFFPTDNIPSGTVVDVDAPIVTLPDLSPGKEYGVTVRGLCYEKEYSPWGDTLLFTMPQDTAIVDTGTIDTTHIGIPRLGNLDRFTQLMPNPASGSVSVFSYYRLLSVAVYDLQGRLVLEQKAEGLFATLDVSALPRGTYIAAISTPQGTATKKLILK